MRGAARGVSWLLVLLLVVLAATGCRDGGGGVEVPVDARVPDVEGVLQEAADGEVVLGGERYELTADAASVSTYTLEPVPLRAGTYVHAGLNEEGRVQWVATIGIVADTDPPVVRYTGRLVERRGDRALFEDGTALLVPPDLTLSAGFLNVELDPATGAILRAATP